MSIKRNKKNVIAYPENWTVQTEIQINGRSVCVGTELSIRGESGRFRFIKHVVTPTSEWIDVVGGKKGYSMMRSFGLDRVRTVHWKNKTMKNIVKERAEKIKNEQS